jgi:hypothetical protein
MNPFKKILIKGCDARGDGDSPYLTRYVICWFKNLKIYLHIFHRSDADELHDHPWNYTSLILWRGYNEEYMEGGAEGGKRLKRRIYPGMLIHRKAAHAHRVELSKGKRAVTLVFISGYKRSWGFYTPFGWQYCKEYFAEKKCNTIN